MGPKGLQRNLIPVVEVGDPDALTEPVHVEAAMLGKLPKARRDGAIEPQARVRGGVVSLIPAGSPAARGHRVCASLSGRSAQAAAVSP